MIDKQVEKVNAQFSYKQWNGDNDVITLAMYNQIRDNHDEIENTTICAALRYQSGFSLMQYTGNNEKIPFSEKLGIVSQRSIATFYVRLNISRYITPG